MTRELYTVGHSTRSSDELLALLEQAGVGLVVDVRRYPGSRRHPQFGRDALAAYLRAANIEYRHEPRLGGRRSGVAGSPNTAWRNAAFRAYADHMSSAEFKTGLDEVLAVALSIRTAVMCAEALPSSCHRRLIADAASLAGFRVIHLIGPRRSEEHVPHEAARLEPQGVVYPAPGQLELPKG